MDITPNAHWTVEFGDFPGGTFSAMVCAHPTAPDGGADFCLPVFCDEHHRSIWWCLNAHDLWCDGGPPDWKSHSWPDMVPFDDE